MFRCLILMSLVLHATSESKKLPAANKKWLTLNGQPPSVIARGGFSGLAPESSLMALQFAKDFGAPGLVFLCNLQLTKDGVGLCQENVNLETTTNIDIVNPNEAKTYNVNGKDVKGWFSVDFTIDDLKKNVTVMQTTLGRPDFFDDRFGLLTIDEIFGLEFESYWINVQNDMLYTQHKLNLASYIQKERLFRNVQYISSPEIGFLKTMNGKVNKAKTKLIFVFHEKDAIEPSTNQTYGSILENLATVKAFASGIAVPKNYIWPVNKANYLESSSTTLVLDAHKLGLQVYATGFANDLATVFNYTYDPVSEYLQFINNPQFSVDGVITDFPPTAAETIVCFASYSELNYTSKDKPLIITHNGASGVYSNCTDLAYQQALNDGAEIIDCSVQMTKDGMAFCMGSADLAEDTTALTTFISRSATIPEIGPNAGIYSFELTWSEIQTLKPNLGSPFANSDKYPRNPAYKNAGKFLNLAEFLELAKAKAASGILINIENAAYLASKKGLDIIGAISTALSNASFDKQSTQKVLIQSDDTAVLSKFQNVPAYTRVFSIKNDISDAPLKSVDEIKKFADAVNVPRRSIYPSPKGLARGPTKVVDELKRANLSVYVSVMRNEFFSLAFDFLSDPTVEIASFAGGSSSDYNLDGIVTEYPATATRYFRSKCSDANFNTYIVPMLPFLSDAAPSNFLGPAAAPNPVLDVADVVDPPLPPLAKITESSSSPAPTSEPKSPSSAALPNVAGLGPSLLATWVLGLLCIGY
ncbi:hypothetical protein P3X46_031693 [Hevea brasiliensis]|uniref:glycerophosphodiester phosphodiesterase n=2 Tax=Hevea brasiliensis TaxID=3981 RepID=A0ABQ9KP33_HEVBR|nr:hypothetical protein P3X46_031693 [Hevea brasiliensis]